jgi:hypothetical protein
MFAIAAIICFVLALFGVAVGAVNLTVLGLAFMALQMLFDWRPWPTGAQITRRV